MSEVAVPTHLNVCRVAPDCCWAYVTSRSQHEKRQPASHLRCIVSMLAAAIPGAAVPR